MADTRVTVQPRMVIMMVSSALILCWSIGTRPRAVPVASQHACQVDPAALVRRPEPHDPHPGCLRDAHDRLVDSFAISVAWRCGPRADQCPSLVVYMPGDGAAHQLPPES